MIHRAVALCAVVVVCSCTSGMSLDLDGGLRFPCTRASLDDRAGNCPGSLFCGADGLCHSKGEQGTYACLVDDDCGGGFRCGPKGACVDPSRDALRLDAPDVMLTKGRVVASTPPWGDITALGVGRTFYVNNGTGVPTDVAPLALSDGTSVYSVAFSQQGLGGSRPPQRFFAGRAPLAGVTDLVAARDQVIAIANGQLYHYRWSPRLDGGALMSELDAGAPVPAIGTRLRTGNSASPFVLEFTPGADAGEYRVFDTSGQYPPTPAKRMTPNYATLPVPITDMADSDGAYVYAIAGGKLVACPRIPGQLTGSPGPASWEFFTFGLTLPGRDQVTTCNGDNISGQTFVFRSLHVGDNPDLTQTERPLVAVQFDVVGDAGVEQHWTRIEPDGLPNGCNVIYRHTMRGNCPVCGPAETLADLQWGNDPATGVSALRSECRGTSGPPVFYDLQTDATGFVCTRTRRPSVGYRGDGAAVRARANPGLSGIALGKNVQVRRDGLDDWAPLTLDVVPDIAVTYAQSLIALGTRSLFVETPDLGLTLHQRVDRQESYPTWISGSWLLYSDGRVGPLSNLALPPQDARFFATPTREDLQPPLRGAQARGSDGRAYLVMSANDALLGAAVTDETGLSAPKEVGVKAVPEPQVPIRSFAVLAPPEADAGVLFQGYVLTENRVFAFDAVTEQRWTLSAVDVFDGEWLEVFADRERGRLGFADGRVYALPSGVQLAKELPGGVTDYEQHCGRSWALNETGLYRLDAKAGEAFGEWVEQMMLLPAGPRWQKMYGAAGGELWLLARDGTAALVKGAPCSP